jgi:ABC-type branched-subunit amino acid transport system substrate-binding protein
MARDRRGRPYPRRMLLWLQIIKVQQRDLPGIPERYKLRVPVLAVYVLLILVALLVPWGRGKIVCLTQSWCRDGLTQASVAGQTELVGVTDAYPFRPQYQHAMDELMKENAYATKDGPGTYVTVAVAGPLTDDDPRDLHRIEGAISGQHAANHNGLVGDRPRIRLVLANMDSGEGHWKLVADRLVKMAQNDDHLIAVAGMGLSQAETVNAMNELRTVNVPTVSDMITADTINNKTYPPFFRTGPDTGQQLDVMARYLSQHPAQRQAMIVAFSKQTDMYTSALKTDFQKYIGGPWHAGGDVIAPFGADPGNEFPQIVNILCGARGINTVDYAGRAADLPLFLADLGNRPGCAAGTVTVITTSDTSRLLVPTAANRLAWQALGNQARPINLIYTPLADPAFLADRPASHQQMAALSALFDQLGFAHADLATGWAITGYDAMLTIAQAARKASGDSGTIPLPQSVSSQLSLTSAPITAVPGASGPIRLDPVTGDRYDLSIPVLSFVPGGNPKILGVYSPDYP